MPGRESCCLAPNSKCRKISGILRSFMPGTSSSVVAPCTYIPDFFRRLGFEEVDRGSLPLKAWKDCLRCPKFQCCDEIAVLKALRSDAVLDTVPRMDTFLIELPQVRR